MKKTITCLAAAFALLIGATSCNDVETGTENKGMGKLEVTFNFPATKGAQSVGVTPTTTWDGNIKDVALVLAEGNTVKQVYPITGLSGANHSAITRVFYNVPAATYTAYIIANYNGSQTTMYGSGASVVPNTAITPAALINTNINNLLLNLATATVSDGGTDAGSFYGEASEVFLAKNTVTVVADQTNTTPYAFALTRAISLARVRLNLNANPTDGTIDNSSVDFRTADKTSFRIRRHGTGINVASAANATAAPYGVQGNTVASNVFYSGKTFKNAAEFTASNYVAGANMNLGTDYSLWNEYIVLAGGGVSADTGDKKFDIVVGGLAPKDYVATDANGNNVTLPSAQVVWWSAQVTNGQVGANGILELNLKLTGKGKTVVPGIGEYGNLSISVDLVEWGTGTSVEIPMPN